MYFFPFVYITTIDSFFSFSISALYLMQNLNYFSQIHSFMNKSFMQIIIYFYPKTSAIMYKVSMCVLG